MCYFFQVHEWLDNLYAGRPVPTFERNERTIDLLYQLLQKNVAMDKDTQLIIEDKRQKATEYTAEGKKSSSRLCYFSLIKGVRIDTYSVIAKKGNTF